MLIYCVKIEISNLVRIFIIVFLLVLYNIDLFARVIFCAIRYNKVYKLLRLKVIIDALKDYVVLTNSILINIFIKTRYFV